MIFRLIGLLMILSVSSAGFCAQLILSEEERAWLHDHGQELRLGVAIVPPYMLVNGPAGELRGLSWDYIKELEQRLGIRFNPVLASSYGEMIRQVRAGETDLVYGATSTPERRQFLTFTTPYGRLETHIFVREDHKGSASMETLAGHQVGVVQGTALHEFIRNNHPDILIRSYPDSSQSFLQLSAGEVDAVVTSVSTAFAYTQRNGLHRIRMEGPVGLNYEMSFGVRKEIPHLTSILQKALTAIPEAEKDLIAQRWFMPRDPGKVDKAMVLRYLAYAGVVIGVLALVWLTWSVRSMRREVSQRRDAEGRLAFLAYHDEITGVLNRSGFMHQLTAPNEGGRWQLIFVLGLDQFRAKNEIWGQRIGNEILRRVAERLQASLGTQGVVARIGGDEFGVMLKQLNTLPELMIKQLLKEIASPLLLGDGSVQLVTATVGASLIEDHADLDARPEQPLERAELALKYAKRHQRGSAAFYDASMSGNESRDQHWKEALTLAIRRHQLFLEYQPQLCLRRSKVIGFEALVRWQHPDQGRISPAEFIPWAERFGLISALGDWVLQTACRQAAEWRKQKLPFDYVAVNVSVRQFVEAGFADRVLMILEQTGLPPRNLELEITETLFMGDLETVRVTLDKLSGHGIRFSIDDFGTGFSSLMYLRQLPVETIKLAQEFVLDMATDASNYQIVRGATHLGHSLGMGVIAEGVETAEVQQALRELNCDMVQGYYYSRPVPASDITPQLLESLAQRAGHRQEEVV
ncbi:EAL domain-containing protein [Marinobacterium jannaschii]|uniref:EAL domain-containing protein n=1 Tax=Marinobacterium jannaschii TaxID=64970 RepID=UPI0012EC3165|nr:EAL domain-containing protein [Marinobacterium jannaschii]